MILGEVSLDPDKHTDKLTLPSSALVDAGPSSDSRL